MKQHKLEYLYNLDRKTNNLVKNVQAEIAKEIKRKVELYGLFFSSLR